MNQESFQTGMRHQDHAQVCAQEGVGIHDCNPQRMLEFVRQPVHGRVEGSG